MLIKIDYFNKNMSVFLCDRCKVRILNRERRVLRVHKGVENSIVKKWDFCPVCYRKLYKGIENYNDKKRNDANEKS